MRFELWFVCFWHSLGSVMMPQASLRVSHSTKPGSLTLELVSRVLYGWTLVTHVFKIFRPFHHSLCLPAVRQSLLFLHCSHIWMESFPSDMDSAQGCMITVSCTLHWLVSTVRPRWLTHTSRFVGLRSTQSISEASLWTCLWGFFQKGLTSTLERWDEFVSICLASQSVTGRKWRCLR